MSAEVLSTLMARSIALTPKEDKQGAKVKLKVFWKTSKFWSSADIADFQKNVPSIAERLRTEQYWNKDGDIRSKKFTCEDFAIRLLCEYAEPKGLPVKLTTGVRTFRNMEIYSASEHDRYASNIYGFTEMVMLSYGAPDMQRTGVNTVAVATPEELQPGDILALAHDTKGSASGGVAHHIQVVVARNDKSIAIYQGNSDYTIHRPLTWLNKLIGRNSADPQQNAYAGLPVERGIFSNKGKGRWDYTNTTTGNSSSDFIKYFDLVRWNFMEFNK
ncbi:hypothetical protein [Xanthomonas oryzae]|uniref:hypothetical protein n=1 Tax=Xanthomonas oryzae TaxID=347 RepID=UPI000949D092|nr:hypothetical protein [Xanthomonas oryzae]OLH85036.1 hypothetical protein DXO216_19355 [Xanthomonas oryzae pv. oryzae]OLK01963.1 hypothetical protein IXO599_20205 [Xanthomonas oryzae pv. oryzae]RBL07568.1 hypothetical protein BRN33_20995 [Xanthomonas oryzae pv. oryzae]UWU54844.1 hypothetical protein BRN95_23230 [Xanthomonas oryzae pv. oryzae]UWZ70865.1 hypothetical protein BHL62_23615 [Xanthomonas oryzae pv. oryzae]